MRSVGGWTGLVGLCALSLSLACQRNAGKRGQAASTSVPAAEADEGWDDETLPAKADDQTLPATSAWYSRDACISALRSGKKLSKTGGHARLASWNLRWFPDGVPGYKARGAGTDITWLACAIALLDADVVAVQEVKTHPAAQAKLNELLKALDGFTAGKWQSMLDDCQQPAGQHVGLLFNARKVYTSRAEIYEAINPHGEACKNQLRPGLGTHLRFPGGLDVHVISVHLKSGSERRSLDLRTKSIAAFDDSFALAQKLVPDEDVLILGDFNAMGCTHCSPEVSAAEERARFDAELGGLQTPMTLVPTGTDCSEYHRGSGTLLDIAAVTKNMRELPATTKLVASGLCGELSCQVLPNGAAPGALRSLSDHCPVYIDLEDRDLD